MSFGTGEPTVFPFVNVTKGDENRNVTVGAGYLFGDGGDINSPMLNFSGCLQVSERLWLMSENYIFFNSVFFLPILWSLWAGAWPNLTKVGCLKAPSCS